MSDRDLPRESAGGAEADKLSPREVVVLQPGDERAQKIGKAIGSQTANDILHILQTHQMTATELAENLRIPMGTVKYHIENLLDAGLLEIRERKYSVKGREVKVYGLKDQLLIVAPKVQNIQSILMKYASLFGIVGLASLVAYSLLPLAARTDGRTREAFNGEWNGAGAGALNATVSTPAPAVETSEVAIQVAKGAEVTSAPASSLLPSPDITPAGISGMHDACSTVGYSLAPTQGIDAVTSGYPVEPVLAFFLGGCLVIGILLLYEVAVWRRTK